MSKNEIFIEKAKKVHGNKYDYSKVAYVNTRTPVIIICQEHGEFKQTPNSHIYQKSECPICAKRKTQKYNVAKNEAAKNTFVERATKIHNGKYDYSKVVYESNKKPVCIICPEHGEFWQRPDQHLFQKRGCPYCGGTKRRTTEEFIAESKKIWGDKYDYSKSQYVNDRSKICLIDKKTGREFWQNVKSHLNGYCDIDVSPRKNLTAYEFIAKAKEVHGDKYDYSRVEYKNFETAVCIVCKKHGEFWQKPHMHLNGNGCPVCNTSKLEKEIIDLLDEENIQYEYQKKFDWLKYKKRMSIDFFLPNENIVIECQGRQHFREEKFFDSNGGYNELVTRDKVKKKLCNEHGLRVLYFSHYMHDYWDKVYYDKEELLEVIKNGTNEL